MRNIAKAVWLPLVILKSLAALAQGTINFANLNPGVGLNAPVVLSDGVTKATGPQFMAGLMAGPTINDLALVATTPFLSGGGAGYFNAGMVTVPSVPGLGTAMVQVVVWNSLAGATFFEALASGMPNGYGASDPFAIVTGDQTTSPPTPPGNLVGLTGILFTLDPLPAPPPPLFIQSTGTNTLLLSWPFSADLFAIQQSSNLAATNWSTLTNLPNFTGTRNRIMVSAPARTTFYRLANR